MGKAIARSDRRSDRTSDRVAATARVDRSPVAAGHPGPAGVRIREASVGDGPRLAMLRVQAEEVHARLLPDYFRVSPAPGPVPPPSSGSGVVTLVADRGAGASGAASSAILGYVTVKVVETPRDPAMTPRRRAHIETIVVDAADRGRGVGTALMRAAADWARRRQAAELVLTVWSDNRAAEALYERLGYQPIARVLRREIDS